MAKEASDELEILVSPKVVQLDSETGNRASKKQPTTTQKKLKLSRKKYKTSMRLLLTAHPRRKKYYDAREMSTSKRKYKEIKRCMNVISMLCKSLLYYKSSNKNHYKGVS